MSKGRFGVHGGQYMPETLMNAVIELEEAYNHYKNDPAFNAELTELLNNYAGRPSRLYFAKHMTNDLGGAKIYLKREDLNHTGAHKINNVLGQALLAKKMGKTRLIAETGAGQHGVATATAAALMGMECVVFMGVEDTERQALNVYRMRLLGAEVIPVSTGTGTLKDACSAAFREWTSRIDDTHYCLGSCMGPHPFPTIVRDFQSVISKEMKDYIAGYYGKAPGKIDPAIQKAVLGDEQPLAPDVAPGSLVTTTYDELAEELGDLAKSEEDVLMYAMFPNEARQFLEKQRKIENTNFLMNDAVSITKEEDYVDIAQIRDLVKLVEESGVGEITVEEAGAKVTIRTPGMQPATYAPAPVMPQAASAPAAAEAPAPTAASTRPASWKPVTAPMVGTFYAAPSPDADPFVTEGATVGAGETLCIVEAMKLMNEIAAEEACVVREVCIDNAAPVEFGTVMFYVEPTAE